MAALSALRLASHGKTRDLDGPELGALDDWREVEEYDGPSNNDGDRCGLEEGEVAWVLVDETKAFAVDPDKVLAGDAEYHVEAERDD